MIPLFSLLVGLEEGISTIQSLTKVPNKKFFENPLEILSSGGIKIKLSIVGLVLEGHILDLINILFKVIATLKVKKFRISFKFKLSLSVGIRVLKREFQDF